MKFLVARIGIFRKGAAVSRHNAVLVQSSLFESFLDGLAFRLLLGLDQFGLVTVGINSQRFQLVPWQPLPVLLFQI